MHKWFTLCLVLKLFTISGQSKFVDHGNGVKLYYGQFYPTSYKYKSPVNDLFQPVFKAPLPLISIGIEHPRGRNQKLTAEWGINYYLNQTKNIGDTLRLNWFANNMYWMFKYDLLKKSRYIHFFVCGGAFIGSQRIIIKDKSTHVYRNFNAALVPQLELRIQPVSRISFGADINFMYDFTSPRWKHRGASDYNLGHSGFSGTQIKFFLGWCFF